MTRSHSITIKVRSKGRVDRKDPSVETCNVLHISRVGTKLKNGLLIA